MAKISNHLFSPVSKLDVITNKIQLQYIMRDKKHKEKLLFASSAYI